MSIYEKNLRRLGILLVVIAVADAVAQLTFYRVFAEKRSRS